MSDADDGSDEGCCPAGHEIEEWGRIEAEEHTGGLEDCSGQQGWGDKVGAEICVRCVGIGRDGALTSVPVILLYCIYALYWIQR